MRWYSLPGWPARVPGHTAATPIPARGAAWGSIQYKDGVTGQPGTARAPAGGPPVPAGLVPYAMGGLSYTAYCPGYYPNIYWALPERQYHPGAGMPISVWSDNLLPIPATDPRQVPAPLAVPVQTMQGGRQIAQPPHLVQWPTVNT